MPTMFDELRRLERKYDGPIPAEHLNSITSRTPQQEAENAVAHTHWELRQAHIERVRLDRKADQVIDEAQWCRADRAVEDRLTAARNAHEAALIALAELTTPRAAE